MLKGFVSGEEKDIVRIPMKVGNEYKEGWEVRDNQDRLIWGREDELQTTTGTLPFKGYSLPVKAKSLLGNAVQNGTPAPDNIITPEMCGVRTGNLFDIESWLISKGAVFSKDGDAYTFSATQSMFSAPFYFSDTDIPVSISGSISGITANNARINLIRADGTYAKTYAITAYVTKSENIVCAGLQFDWSVAGTMRVDSLMLNLGSTALPYEPYGYKIPITNAGQTTTVYLGEVPTVRRVKKRVFDGTEYWSMWGMPSSSETERFYINVDNAATGESICSHFPRMEGNGDIPHFRFGGSNNNELLFWVDKLCASTITDLRSYLAAKYAAGTPVTVWYAITTPTTGIVNEPLCKIGDYADELNDTVATLPEIPTTTGQNTLTVDTTLAPSSLTVKGHIKELT